MKEFKRGKNEALFVNNLDKTIMKMKAEQRSSHASFFSECLSHYGLHNLLSFWTRMIIELRIQITTVATTTATADLVRETNRSEGKKSKSKEEASRSSHNFLFFFSHLTKETLKTCYNEDLEC